ncbi:MAG: hypothetical protein KGZ34_07085 [Nitrosarchaeum sp.]|nr:hypothetical protein [Nitrosarchaeum sp.]
MSVAIAGGLFLIGTGYFTSIEKPPLQTHDSFNEDLRIVEPEPSGFRIVYDANGGFYTGRGVDPFLQLDIIEEIQNTTKVQFTFFDGRISSIENRKYVSVRDEPITLEFHGTNTLFGETISQYVAEPDLTYDSSGIFSGEIMVIMQGKEPYEKIFPNVIEIKSIDEYRAAKNDLYQSGIALMVFGITLVAASPAFVKLFEYVEEFKEKQKN